MGCAGLIHSHTHPTRANAPTLRDHLALAGAAGAGLAYQIVLLRVFSFSQWHHFASLAISLALLGFGAAGTILTLLGERARRWGDGLFTTGFLIAGLGVVAVFALNQTLAVRPLFAAWDPRELGRLLLLNFAAFVPFLGIALAIGQVFVRWPAATRHLYGTNMVGSGVGSLAAVALLASMGIVAALITIACFVLTVGALFGLRGLGDSAASHEIGERLWRRRVRTVPGVLCLLGLAGVLTWAGHAPIPHLHISDFKPLARLLDLPEAQVLERRHGLHASATVVRSPSIRIAPGLSLNWLQTVPSCDALVLDADRVIPLHGPSPGTDRHSYRKAMLGALPFELGRGGAAVIGASPWSSQITAIRIGGLKRWVLDNPQITRVHRNFVAAEFSPRHLADLRRYLQTTHERFGVIMLEAAAVPGDALTEQTLLTIGGLTAALDRLKPDGLLAIPLRLENPPRYFPKLMTMLRRALHRAGAEHPAAHVLIVRSMREAVVMAGRQPLQPGRLDQARHFADRWSFDLVWAPDIQPKEPNRHHLLAQPLYYQSARALLAGMDDLPRIAGFYDRRPATDARPYFWRSIRWSTLPGLFERLGRTGLIFLDWGLIVLLATLVTAVLLAGLLVLVPLGRVPRGRDHVSRRRVLIYFTGLGLGFLLLELAAFQRSIMLLGPAVLVAPIVFSTFLIGSGIGSFTAPERFDRRRVIQIFGLVAAGFALAATVLWGASDTLWRAPGWVRGGVIVAALLPLAFAMGRPMPWGLRRLGEHPNLIPWAWGINGFASVLAPLLAQLISVEAGQPWTWAAGLTAYGLAFTIGWHWSQ